MITTITKRDGRTVHFDINKIASAIEKASRKFKPQTIIEKWGA